MVVIMFGAIAVYLLSALVGWSAMNLRLGRSATDRERADEISEAGVDYYRWHLAHAANDYKDGTAVAGPYVHPFLDKDGNNVGSFSLAITAPPTGSTLTTVASTGRVSSDSSISRAITVQLAIPSLAKYAVAANDDMRFGAGTEVFGPIVSNGGIRFDGVAHNVISSAKATYTDPDSDQNSFGVHTLVSPADPSPPAAVPNRPDVFLAGRQFPVASVDFAGITTNLAQIKTSAQASGLYFSNSGFLGYHAVLKTNDTFDLYRVKTLVASTGSCNNSANQTGWGSWSIKSGGEQLIGNYAFPANGILFFDDHLWIDGQINGARLTIGAGTFPDNASTRRNIIINAPLLYTNFDGTDVIGLIAQDNVTVGMVSSDVLTVDAAVIAQNGRVGRFYYPSGCSPYASRSTITLFGMIATNDRYGFAYTDGTGYDTRNINYDGNFLYAPPPSFPLTSNQYQTISWKEAR